MTDRVTQLRAWKACYQLYYRFNFLFSTAVVEQSRLYEKTFYDMPVWDEWDMPFED